MLWLDSDSYFTGQLVEDYVWVKTQLAELGSEHPDSITHIREHSWG